MKFYGNKVAVEAWEQIIANVFNKECTEIVEEENQYYFEAEMTEEDMEFVEKHYMYVVQIGQELQWKNRITLVK